MSPVPAWHWPRDAALNYCFKVAAATLLGYVLARGGPQYAIYGAFSAALIVGASRGEDVGTAANRVRGSLAGMLAGTALAYASLPPALAVALGIGVTAYLCMGCGWGVPAARVGATLCAVTILLHGDDPLGYGAIRVLNTLIGIACGLAVSYLVLPVRGRDAVARAERAALAAVAELLGALASATEPLPAALHMAVLHRLLDLDKAVGDARHELGRAVDAVPESARRVGLVCAGALTAAIAHVELCASPARLAPALALRARAAGLAARAGAAATNQEAITPAPAPAPVPAADAADGALALQGLALGLLKIEQALAAIGR